MKLLDEMTGARLLIAVRCMAGVYELMSHPDGRFGIVRDGITLGVWEREEQEECLSVLGRLTGITTETEPLLVVRLMDRCKNRATTWN